MTCFLHISSAVKYLKDNPDLCVQLIQECLSPAERRQIVEDLHDQLPDICQSIDNLNTALSFLKALGGQTSVFLHEFMSSTLKMKRTLYSRKVCLLYIGTQISSVLLSLVFLKRDLFFLQGLGCVQNKIVRKLRTQFTQLLLHFRSLASSTCRCLYIG